MLLSAPGGSTLQYVGCGARFDLPVINCYLWCVVAVLGRCRVHTYLVTTLVGCIILSTVYNTMSTVEIGNYREMSKRGQKTTVTGL